MLVAAGANLAIQDNEGKTPKVLALLADDHSLAAYLESKLNLPRAQLSSYKWKIFEIPSELLNKNSKKC